MTKGSRKNRSHILDFVLYVLISSGVIAIVLVAICLKVDWITFMNRSSFVVLTSVVFGYFVAASRTSSTNRKLWFMTIFLLVLHSFAFLETVRQFGFFKPGWYPVGVLELAFVILCRNGLVSKTV